MSDLQQRARGFVSGLETWLRSQRISSVVPRDRLLGAINELRADEAFWDGLKPRFEKAWERGEARLRQESRPANEVLSPEAVERILEGIERIEPDPEAVRTFLASPAIEKMLGEVLYHGITEFLKKADLLGRAVNRLPVLGPLRKKVMNAFKDEFEGRMEGQIKGFLGSFSGKAVERMIEHVLSDEHQAGFRSARRKLGEHLLARPLNTLIPGEETTARLREQAWEAIRRAALRDEAEFLGQVYDDHGDETWGDWTWKLSGKATELFAGPLTEFLQSEAGQAWSVEERS